jgi:hypothetical protein
MFTPLSSNAVSASSLPQIFFPETTQRLGYEKKEAQVQKTTARNLQPKASNAIRVSKNPAGDSFQSSRPAEAKHKLSEQSTPDDLPTKAFTGLGSSVGSFFGIQF